jgi:hypothetical protein
MKVMAVFAALAAIALGILFSQLPKRHEARQNQVTVSGTTFKKPGSVKAVPSREGVATPDRDDTFVIKDSGASIALMPAGKKPAAVVTEAEFKAKTNQN